MIPARVLFFLILFLLSGPAVLSQGDPLASVRKSHIDANVPDEKVFHIILQRDITRYVTDSRDKGVSVTVELLRNAPTQSGVALPKYYCWIEKRDAHGAVLEQAAARIAAVEKKRFEVLQYFTKEHVTAEPERMKGVFPADVYEKILAKVKSGQR